MKSIRDILTGEKPTRIPSSSNIIQAAETMKEARVGALLVSGPEGNTVGVFSERDLMTRVVVAKLDPESTTLESVMTTNIYVATPDKSIREVALEMQERHIRHLPVIENDQVLAMLSLRDLLRAHIEIKRSEVEDLTSYIQGEG